MENDVHSSTYYGVRSLSARVTRRAPEIRPLKKGDFDENPIFSQIFENFERRFSIENQAQERSSAKNPNLHQK